MNFMTNGERLLPNALRDRRDDTMHEYGTVIINNATIPFLCGRCCSTD